MDLNRNTVFRHILAQEGQANIIKAIKHGKKQVDMLGKLQNMLGSKIKQEIYNGKLNKKKKIYYGKK